MKNSIKLSIMILLAVASTSINADPEDVFGGAALGGIVGGIAGGGKGAAIGLGVGALTGAAVGSARAHNRYYYDYDDEYGYIYYNPDYGYYYLDNDDTIIYIDYGRHNHRWRSRRSKDWDRSYRKSGRNNRNYSSHRRR